MIIVIHYIQYKNRNRNRERERERERERVKNDFIGILFYVELNYNYILKLHRFNILLNRNQWLDWSSVLSLYFL